MDYLLVKSGEESTRELLQAQIHVWHHAYSFVTSMAVKAAVQLGLPEAVQAHGAPISLPELTSALGIPPAKVPHFHRLLRVIVNSGYLSLHKPPRADANHHGVKEGSRYSLTTAGRLLTRDNPYKAGAYLRMVMAPLLMEPYQSMGAWLKSDREGTTPFSEAHGGKEAWEFMAAEPEFASLFNEAMGGDSCLIAELVVKDGKKVFEGVGSLVDVGGGTGYLAKAIAGAFPDMSCTVLDLPHVVSGLENSGNLKYVAGDMFVHVPAADAVILKWILHDWSDEDCVKILVKCKKAVTSDGKVGKVIVIDMVLGNQSLDEKSVGVQYGFDMGMMISVTGKERDEEELAKVFFEAGFSSYHINPILGTRALIEVYP